MRRFWLLAAITTAAHAEIYTLTLRQAIERALAQNPDIVMARLDEAKSNLGVKIAKDPFAPHMGAGSGLAYSNGFPLSIEGSAPAIFESKITEDLFNRSQTFAVRQAKENAHGAGIATAQKRDEIVYRVATLYIDVDRTGRLAANAEKEVESLTEVLRSHDALVQLGRELPVEKEEANLNFLHAQQRLVNLQSDREYGERSLAVTLGYGAGDAVRPAPEERTPPPIPDTEEAALKTALDANKELKRLASSYRAKALEIGGDKAQRLPRVDLVAEYDLLATYSNYQEYFVRFKRNNAEIGASIQVPLLAGPGAKAAIQQAEADQQHLRAEMDATRNRIMLDVHQSFDDVRKANIASQVAKAEVDLAHSRLSILLAQMNEGRATLKQVEEARSAEDEKWSAFYDTQFTAEKARLNVLRQTGELAAALGLQ